MSVARIVQTKSIAVWLQGTGYWILFLLKLHRRYEVTLTPGESLNDLTSNLCLSDDLGRCLIVLFACSWYIRPGDIQTHKIIRLHGSNPCMAMQTDYE